jgi:cellulose synthase/poly-beta-1,6-N-acetylglucosamine synthase-like glycosyltransferase
MVAVVIGRNEGERLKGSLRSTGEAGLAGVYVDSGSHDGSAATAAALGFPVLELDPARPFSAARARNEGLEQAARLWPGAEYVMFLDGDCLLDPAFPSEAIVTFEAEPDCAIVTGHLSERSPDVSVYHRLCAIEWHSPAGRIENFAALGGIMAARIQAVRQVGGFNEQVIAGEDSELGVRLSLSGRSVIKIDRRMAIHDAQMTRFSEWWKRSVRAGHALAQRYSLNGRSRLHDCRRELVSTLLWGFAVPLLAVALLIPTRGLSLVLLGGYVVLARRAYVYYAGTGASRSDAAIAARFTVISKFANFIGVLRFCLNWLRGSFRIIEYK